MLEELDLLEKKIIQLLRAFEGKPKGVDQEEARSIKEENRELKKRIRFVREKIEKMLKQIERMEGRVI